MTDTSKPKMPARLALGLAGGLLLTLASVPALADDDPKKPRTPSPEQGQALAEKLCSGCHVTGADAGGAKPDGPPPFTTIANRPEQTADRIKGVLIQPHAPMPDLQLTNDEMSDLIAYIDTMRKVEPPLLPSGTRDKPKRPEPT